MDESLGGYQSSTLYIRKMNKRITIWWLVLLVLTALVSLATSKNPTVMGMLFSILGHVAFAFVASLIPSLAYWAIKRPMNMEEYMSTFTVAWLILAVANLLVM